jgi:formylglycine-generating enzyme required for sulfatase activity
MTKHKLRRSYRVLQGGCCAVGSAGDRATCRGGDFPGNRSSRLRFRCARTHLAAFVDLDRVFRCGNANLHSTFRFSGAPDTTDNDLGFRCLRRRE